MAQRSVRGSVSYHAGQAAELQIVADYERRVDIRLHIVAGAAPVVRLT